MRKRILKSGNTLRDLSDKIKRNKIHIIGIPEEEREKGPEKLFDEIMAENIPNLKKEIYIQAQELQRVPNKVNPNRLTPRYIIKWQNLENFKGIKRETMNNKMAISIILAIITLKANGIKIQDKKKKKTNLCAIFK